MPLLLDIVITLGLLLIASSAGGGWLMANGRKAGY